MSSAREEMIRCPFWRGTGGTHQINCEGLVPDSNTCLMFRNRQKTDEHLRDYCWSNYQGCELYQAIHAKYEREKRRPGVRLKMKDPCTTCSVACDWANCERRKCKAASDYWKAKWEATTELFKTEK